MTPLLISVGFLESKIESYDCEPVLYSQGGDRQEAPQTDLVRISPLQLSSLLHVNLLALLILNPHYSQDPQTSAQLDLLWYPHTEIPSPHTKVSRSSFLLPCEQELHHLPAPPPELSAPSPSLFWRVYRTLQGGGEGLCNIPHRTLPYDEPVDNFY